MRPRPRSSNGPRAPAGARARLIVSFLVIVLPAFLLLLAAGYRQFRSDRSAGLAESHAVAEGARALLLAELDQAAAALRLAVSEEGSQPSAASDTWLEQPLAAHPEYLSAFLLDGEGQLAASASAEHPPVPDQGAFTAARAAGRPAVSDLLYAPPDSRPAFQLIVPLAGALAPAAYAGLTLDAQWLADDLAPLVEAGPYEVTLCDRRGWSIYTTLDPNLALDARDWSGYSDIRQALGGHVALAAGVVSHVDGRAYLEAAVPVPETGWAISVYQPVPALPSYLGQQALFAALALAVSCGVALLAANSYVRWHNAPLARLAEHARALGRGQLNERITVERRDEFGALAAALNGMAQQMEERDRRLRARTAELDAIITQSADGIAIHGPEGELLRLNPAGSRILGRAPGRLGLALDEQPGYFHVSNVAGEPIDPSELPVAAALRGETRLAELLIETEGGEQRYVAASASPLSDSRGRIYGAVTILHDITQTYEAQKEKDDFISLVSHELKTPITSIKGYAQMLLRRAEEGGRDERDLKGLRIINEEVDRMVDLINQLLDVSRLETHRLQLNWDLVDLVALTHDAVDRLQMTTTRHTLQLRAPAQPVWVEGDGMRLAQVLGNLLMNAIKYSPAGGPVEVTLESQEGRGWVSVRDWGVGIAPEDQPHVFQRFYRGTRKGLAALSGMGLGLYISREIVQRHHGDIVFHSRPGQGTTFLFWLPLAKKDESGCPGSQTHPEGAVEASRGDLSGL